MDIDPSCTFASMQITARNQRVASTLRDALSGVFAWPVFIRARDPEVAKQLVHATANHVRGELARTEQLLSTCHLRHMTPSTRCTDGVDESLHRSMTTGEVLVVDGVDERPISADTIIRIARVMHTMRAAKRPVVTIASLANDAADGLLAQLTTRYAGGRPAEWHCTKTRRERRAA